MRKPLALLLCCFLALCTAPVKAEAFAAAMTLSTARVDAISSSLWGRYTSARTPTEYGFLYAALGERPLRVQGTQTPLRDSMTYCVTLRSLRPQCQYVYQAYAVIDGRVYQGERRYFTTTARQALASALPAKNITLTTAELPAQFHYRGIMLPQYAGVMLGKTPTSMQSAGMFKLFPDEGTVRYTCSVQALVPNTTYYYRAFLNLCGHMYYSDTRTFTTPSENKSPFRNPLRGECKITSPFGPRETISSGGIIIAEEGYHKGVDVYSSDHHIYAAMAGEVVRVDWNGINGNYVLIDHKNGLYTFYSHMDSVSVHEGKTVKSGALLGMMGKTGSATGVHLHFAICREGKFNLYEYCVNPLLYVSFR